MLSFLAVAFLATTTVSASPSQPHHGHPSAGCGKTHQPGYNSNGGDGFTLVSGGFNRTYTVFVPDNYQPKRAYPLVIDYHGRGGDSDTQFNLSRFNEFNSKDFVYIYPQGYRKSWEGASYHQANVSDLLFTTDLVTHFQQNYCIDSQRLYASGKSNGAGFVDTLACSKQGDLFAAFSMCSPALYTDNLLPSAPACYAAKRQRPILEFHGSNDTTVPYDGGEGAGGTTPFIPPWLNLWGQRDGCRSGAGKSDYGHDRYGSRVNHTKYECRGTCDIVQAYWIKGMGHSWPATTPNSDNEKHDDGVAPLNASPIILKYFSSWTLKGKIGY